MKGSTGLSGPCVAHGVVFDHSIPGQGNSRKPSELGEKGMASYSSRSSACKVLSVLELWVQHGCLKSRPREIRVRKSFKGVLSDPNAGRIPGGPVTHGSEASQV